MAAKLLLLCLAPALGQQRNAAPGVNPQQYQQDQQQFQGQPPQNQQFQGQPPPNQQFQGQPPQGQPPSNQQFQGQPPPPQQFQGQPPQGQPQQFQGQPQQFQPGQGQPPPPQQFQGQPQQFQGQPPPPGQFQGQPQQGQPQQFQGQAGQGPPQGAAPVGQGQGPPQQARAPQAQKVLHKDKAGIDHEKEHMKEHQAHIDTSNMSEQELQFHYFKMHDSDGNNKLDGLELVKSLIHWHDEANHDPKSGRPAPEAKIFKDDELQNMIDPILDSDDKNKDGFIDYPEFIAAQQAAAAANEK